MSEIITLHTECFIDSAHRLVNYNGKCSQMHGHTWKLEVWIQGTDAQKDEVGILFDFGEVKHIKDMLDHKVVNDIVGLNPTAENITSWILEQLKVLKSLQFRVKLFETAVGKETWCQRQTERFDARFV